MLETCKADALHSSYSTFPPSLPSHQHQQCDVVSGGSQVNPSVSVAMFVHGAISFPGAIVRILAQLAAGVVAYPLLQKLSPTYVGVGGPGLQDGISTTTGALAEFTLTFGLLTLIYLAITIIGAPGQVGGAGGVVAREGGRRGVVGGRWRKVMLMVNRSKSLETKGL